MGNGSGRVRSVQDRRFWLRGRLPGRPKAADDFKKGQQSKWIDALRARAEEGRISDVALDDFVGRYGMPALHREFRGVLEKRHRRLSATRDQKQPDPKDARNGTKSTFGK